MMGVLVFTGCSNDDQLGVDNLRKYESSFVQTFGKVNPNQDFNTQRAVGIDVSVSNTQGNYTLRVFSAMPNTKGAKLLGKFENLNAGQVSTVSVDAHKASKNIYCMVDDGVHNRTKKVAIPSSGKASVKFDGIASPLEASTRANDDVVDIIVDDDFYTPNAVTIAFEDLGASDDFDFNDAVFKVEYVYGEGFALKVTLMAVGAVLPLKLYYFDTYTGESTPIFDGMELHEAMGESVNTMINTNWKGNGAIEGRDDVEFVSDVVSVPWDCSLSDNAFPFILEVDGKTESQYRITSNGPGAIPQVIVIGDLGIEVPHVEVATRSLSDAVEGFYFVPWRWTKERVSILEAYPNIKTWIEDNPDDYSFMTDGVVDDKLYGGYNPTGPYEDEAPIELQAVDLGLSSGTLWANMNVGASSPEQAGCYYAWGETTEKDCYLWNTYLYNGDDGKPNFNSFDDIRGTQYDVAHVVMGGDWVMPTKEQFEELFNECDIETEVSRKGMPGVKVTGPSGNSIFFPLSGLYYDEELDALGVESYYWTSTRGRDSFYDDFVYWISMEDGSSHQNSPYFGFSVRGVINKSQPQTPAGLEAVDLGLLSGTKWANMNVGATAPEEYGGYYAWGETEEKDYYDGSTYAYYKDDNYIYIGDDIAGTKYDVAHMKWGGDWVMPTKDQIDELIKKCTYEMITVNNVNGGKFTGPNGNSIFLPAAGYRWGGDLSYAGLNGYYWSSTQRMESNAYVILFGSGYADWFYSLRYYGQSVRPVICGE